MERFSIDQINQSIEAIQAWLMLAMGGSGEAFERQIGQGWREICQAARTASSAGYWEDVAKKSAEYRRDTRELLRARVAIERSKTMGRTLARVYMLLGRARAKNKRYHAVVKQLREELAKAKGATD